MMKGKFNKTDRRGLPGGPNEQFTYVTGVFSTEGYKRNSPDVNKPQNIIEGDQYYGTPITMGDVDFPVKGVDNLGNEKIMYPEEEHHFPGSMVYETPIAQQGGEFQRLVKKYTTQGWASLTPQEQQFYRETYQRGGSLPRYQSKGEVLTYQDNPEYFDNKAVLGDNIRYSDLVKKRVYAGTHGYNPTTGEMVKLDSPQGGATGLDLAYSKREEDRTSQDNRQVQHAKTFKDLQALYRNPLFYAPAAIATAGTLGPAALANPYVQAGLTGLGVYDATTHSIPGAVKATKEGRYLDAAGNTAMASLDLLPIPFFGTNLVQEAKSIPKILLGKNSKLIKPPKGAIDANDNLLPDINTKGLSKKDIKIAKKLWGEQMTNTRFVNQPFEQIYNRFANPKLFVEKYKKYKKEYPNLNDKELSFIIGKDKDVLMASDEYANLKHISEDPEFDQYLLKEGLYNFKTDLTPLEAYLQSKYTHGYDAVLNAVNRGENKVGNKHFGYENMDPSYVNFLKESSDQLNKLIQKTKFNLPTNVFRNIGDDHIVKVYDKSGNFLRDDKFKNIKVGESYIEKGFSSTSVPSRAKPKGHRDMSKESMKIEIPGGKKQSFLHPNEFVSLTKYPDESEALLPRGLRFEKTKMRDRETNDDFYSHWKILNPYQQGGNLPKAQRGFNFNDLAEKKKNEGWDSLTADEQQFYTDYYNKTSNQATMDAEGTYIPRYSLPAVTVNPYANRIPGEDITREGIMDTMGSAGKALGENLYEFTGVPSAGRIKERGLWETAVGVKDAFGAAVSLPDGITRGIYNYMNTGDFDMGLTKFGKPYSQGLSEASDALAIAPGIGMSAKAVKPVAKALTKGPYWLKGYQKLKTSPITPSQQISGNLDELSLGTLKKAKPNANRFENITDVNPLSQDQARNLVEQGRIDELFSHFKEGAKTIDDFKKDYLKDLTSDEGIKRLINQEADYLRSIGMPEHQIAKRAEINAFARINEIKDIKNLNKNFIEGRHDLSSFIENKYNYNNAYYSAPMYGQIMDDVLFPKKIYENAIDLIRPKTTRIGSKSVPGKTGLGTMFSKSKPSASHEIGGHGLQADRVLPVDNKLRKLEVDVDVLNDYEKDAYEYFIEGSKGKEPSAYAHEFREAMLQAGLIKNRYQHISPSKIKVAKKYFELRPSGTVNKFDDKFSSDTRIVDLMKPTESNYQLLSDVLNNLPAIAGVAGTGSVLSQEKEGGSINLDPAKKGTFKALATRYGMSMDKLAMDMKSNPNKYSPGARKKANFYRNFVMQSGGSTNNKQFEIYQNYINGEFDEVSEEEAEKVYDKLNRIYYAEAKKEGMSPANYIMTYVLGNK